MNFCSDNTTGASPEVLAAIAAANDGAAMPYGNDNYSRRAEERIAEFFEAPADVFLVATGTAANALCLSVMTPPYGAVFCHPQSHIHEDECGAPEFSSGGAKLRPLPDHGGKIDAQDLATALARPDHGVHSVQSAAVSIAQASEAGTLYSVAEVRAIAEVAHGSGLKVHMDGARLANAIAALGCAPADVTWRAGVDAHSFGATKNGALAAEAAVLFDHELANTFPYRRKRGGHLFSKMRFLGVQFEAYLEDDLWLRNARHANAMAGRLADGLISVPGARLRHAVEANEIFVSLPEAAIAGLEADGFLFYRWPGDDPTLLRLVASFATQEADVDALIARALHHAGVDADQGAAGQNT